AHLRAAARRVHRVRGRREQRPGAGPRLPPRPALRSDRRRGGGARARDGRARGFAHGGAGGRAARQQDLSPAGRDRADPERALDLRRPRLPRRRPRARLSPRQRARDLRHRDRRRGGRGAPAADRHRGHHPRPRERARGGARHPPGAAPRPPADPARQPLRPRRQGHGDGRRLPRGEAHVSRIAETFAALRARGQVALVPYFTAGDPDLPTTRDLVRAALAEGADAIELGVPFSDPMADGPVLQRSGARALAAGTTLPGVLYVVSVLGVTGARAELPRELPALVRRARAVTHLPLGVGFGVGRPEQAAWIAGFADAVIVGSALARLVEEGEREAPARVASFLGGLRRAIGAAAAARTA